MGLVVGGRALAIPIGSSRSNCIMFPSVKPSVGDKCLMWPHPTKAGYYIALKPKRIYEQDSALAVPIGKRDSKRNVLTGNVRNYFPKSWQKGFSMQCEGGAPEHLGWDCSPSCSYYGNPQPCYIARYGSISNTAVYCSYVGGQYRIPKTSQPLYSCNMQIIDPDMARYCELGRKWGCKKYGAKNQTLVWFTTGSGPCMKTSLLTQTQPGVTTYSCSSSCPFYSNHFTPCLRGRYVPIGQTHFTNPTQQKPCPNGPMTFSGYRCAGNTTTSSCVLNMGKATEFARVRSAGDSPTIQIGSQYGSLCNFSPRTGGTGSAGTSAGVTASLGVPTIIYYQGASYCPLAPAPQKKTTLIYGSQSDRY